MELYACPTYSAATTLSSPIASGNCKKKNKKNNKQDKSITSQAQERLSKPAGKSHKRSQARSSDDAAASSSAILPPSESNWYAHALHTVPELAPRRRTAFNALLLDRY